MPVYGVENFIGERLAQARNTRGLSAANLADLVGVSPTSISLYEKNKQNPKQEVVEELARILNVPVGLFFKKILQDSQSNLFYRSMSSATKRSRSISESKYRWTIEAIDYLLQFFDFPDFNLPNLEIPTDFRELKSSQIETAAQQLREAWQLGGGPISNMTRTLESNGIVVWRTLFEAEKLDAFSEYRTPHPVVVLSNDKNNYYRSRFDAAHELGHLILHRNVNQVNLRKASDFKTIEEQAHLFAGSFLLPAVIYARDLKKVSLDVFRALKPRWNVSIAMQIMRARQLDLLGQYDEKRIWINLSRRKWRKSEPLDDITLPEKPNLIASSFKLLVNENVKTRQQVIDELAFSSFDLDKIIETANYFNNASLMLPKFKPGPSEKVVPFINLSERMNRD